MTLRVKTFLVAALAVFMMIGGGEVFLLFASAAEGEGYHIAAVDAKTTENGFMVSIAGNTPPTFTVYELFDPLRIVIDIANASLGSAQLPMAVNQGPVASVAGQLLAEKEPVIAKLEIFLIEDREYSVKRVANNIEVSFSADQVGPSDLEKSVSGAEAIRELYNVKIEAAGEVVTVLLVAGQPIENYRHAELPAGSGRPDRIYIDIDEITAPTIPPMQEVGKGPLARVRTASRENGLRIVFDSRLNGPFEYDVMAVADGLKVTIREPATAEAGEQADPVGNLLAAAINDSAILVEEDAGQEQAAEREGAVSEQLKNVGVTKDMFSSLGYDQQKISVDFYKTNLHNVFRLIGEISGRNVVVDDAVSGSLTLSLESVPWDFILDVITNLKGLQKEERYNTIVISPQAKGFVWPEPPKVAAVDSDLEAPSPELEMTLDQQLSQAPEVIAVKMKIQRANNLRQEGNAQAAITLYEQALEQYTDDQESAALAKLIAGMYLADLGINIKAVDYARKALALNPEDQEISLIAAIGLANMGQAEARDYFEKATAGQQPTRDALINYAAYAEDTGDHELALANLTRYEELYDHSLETMVSKARIYDGMGKSQAAVEQYRLILNSGYEVDPDLAQYIKARIALDQQ